MSTAAEQETRLRRTRPRRRRRRMITWVLLFILLFVPAFGFAAVRGWVPTAAIDVVARLFIGRQPGAVPWNGRQPVNILVMGLQVGGASTSPLTDSMMVVSYDPGTESISMLSIPRDLWVEIPENGSGRINEAFQDGGAGLAMLTVQQNLGIPVNYYALVSYDAFEKLIDDVGGITVDVPREMDDPTFPAADEIHYEPFHISKGIHHLNGHDALRYARSRHDDPLGDMGRADRQQQVIVALKEQMLKPANLVKAGLILRDARATIRTNFPLDQAAGLGLKALRVEKKSLQRQVLQYENEAVRGANIGGASVLVPNKKAVRQITSNLFAPSLAYLHTGATVRVDNGNGYNGAASGFSKVLSGMGVDVLEPDDADRKNYPKSRVLIYGRDKASQSEGEFLASMLGVQAEKGSGSSGADVVIILGRDYAPFVEFTSKDWEDAIQPN